MKTGAIMSFNLEKLAGITAKIRGPIGLAFSYQAEDAAALHLLSQCGAGTLASLEIFTLDTGKFFPETQTYHETMERFFRITIKRYYPEKSAVEELEQKLGGEWGMRESLEKRRLCCRVRKVEPLSHALAGKSAWVTGLRIAQSETRADLAPLEYDEAHGLIKINPLFDWTNDDLAQYIAEHQIPMHPLYERNFKSIGCAPCTRAVKPGEDIRAGRWWWENPEHKECGLHKCAFH
jgi:phosphoadenosine phosphosulfate reductase